MEATEWSIHDVLVHPEEGLGLITRVLSDEGYVDLLRVTYGKSATRAIVGSQDDLEARGWSLYRKSSEGAA